ncbi:hypothetical protein HWV62_12106 [Athelia sp. TMB]|nr:hypothetical protein HWV62_12106 [Athelia sp. TMB]
MTPLLPRPSGMAGLGLRTVGLEEFASEYFRLASEPEVLDAEQRRSLAAKFALCGRDGDTQINVDVLRNRLRNDSGQPTQIRDFDSVLGFMDGPLAVWDDILVYPIANPAYTLTSSVYVKHPYSVDGQRSPRSPHTIPNICIAKTSERTTIRVQFPGLAREGYPTGLEAEHKAAVYDTGIYRAIARVSPEAVTNWSADYQSALWRASKGNNQHQYSTHAVSRENTAAFFAEFRRLMTREHPWAAGMVFMVQIQGLKEATQHSCDRAEAEGQLNLLLHPFYLQEGAWFVDVGLEISIPGQCLQWRSDGHLPLLQRCLDISYEDALAATKLQNRKYCRDMAAHLPDLSGFRVELNSRQGGAYHAAYAQAYTTDKGQTYHISDKHHSKRLTGHQAVVGLPPKYINDAFSAYRAASLSTDVSARLEFRVPIEFATTVLINGIRQWLLEKCLVVYSKNAWWGWKCCRVRAIGTVLGLQNLAPATIRFGHLALNLTLLLIWLANSIHSRPDDDNGARALLLTGLPLTDNHNSRHLLFVPTSSEIANDLEVPHCPFNCVFIKDMMSPPQSGIFRLTHGESMDDLCCLKYFGLTYEALRAKRVHVGILTKSTITAKNIPTMKGGTKANLLVEPEIDQHIARLPLIQIPVPGRGEYGPDMPYNGYHLPLPEHQDSRLRITKMLNQFASDIMQKCGNSKDRCGDSSHCKLDKHDRRGLDVAIFNDTTLSNYFWRVQWRYQDESPNQLHWWKLFKICFPSGRHELKSSGQNWRKMQYYTAYKDVIASCTAQQEDALRRQLWSKFKNLAWIPAVETDRVWRYDRKEGYISLPGSFTGRAPRIVVRSHMEPPRWEQEEEEEEEILSEGEEDDGGEDAIFLDDPPESVLHPPRRDVTRYFRREEEEESSEGEIV